MIAMTGVMQPEKLSRVDQLWRYEEERGLRRQRVFRIIRKLVALVMVAALGLLAYAAGTAALALRKDKPLSLEPGTIPYIANIHGSWIYPAAIAGAAGFAALLILVFGVFRRSRSGSHRG
jgi:hypothetical protein